MHRYVFVRDRGKEEGGRVGGEREREREKERERERKEVGQGQSERERGRRFPFGLQTS
jgi:hypothetical protein